MVQPTLIKQILDEEGNVIETNEPVYVCDITSECRLRCDNETNKCRIDTLGLCDPDAGTCRVSTNPESEIDPDYYSKMGGVINVMNDIGDATGELKTVAPWVIQMAQEAMHRVVTDGTATSIFEDFGIDTAGKTGTAEYCDDIARVRDICKQGQWPAHAWYAGYAPAENPEIVVVAFVYHGQEGSLIAAPIVRKVMDAYFEFKGIDNPDVTQ
jgi:membrane carboxypeptidase/penicillin-binding protein